MRELTAKKTRRLAALILAFGLLFLAGCGGEKAPGPAAYQEGAVFRLGVTEQPDSLNPFLADDRLSKEFFLLVYDPLWRLNASGEPVNCLVDDWSLSSDQLTWTVRLRNDVSFSDGTRLTSEDVAFTYQELMRGETAYTHCFDGITSVRCPDDYTLIITTSYVKGDMQYLGVPILPKHIWSAYVGNMAGFDNESMIGSGPFVRQIVDLGPQEISWTFSARANYFGGAPKVGGFKFIYYATATGAGRAISAAEPEIDGVIGLTDVQLTTLEGVPGTQLTQTYLPESQVWAVAFNTRSAVFQEASLRQMVEYCADRDRIVSMSAGDAAMAGSAWSSPGVDYYYTVNGLRTYNPEAARAILNSMGYSDVDGDGSLEHIGTREPLSLILYTGAEDDWSSSAATILTEALTALGVHVDRRVTEGPVEDVCGPQDDWDMCMLSWRGDSNVVMAARQFAGSADSLTGWSSENYTATFGRLQTALDRNDARDLAGQLQQIVYDECPYLILGYYSDIQAFRDDAWTGYEDTLNAAGGLFCNDSIDAYMTLAPAEAGE